MKPPRKIFKVCKAVSRMIRTIVSTCHVRLLFRLNGIRFGRSMKAIGLPSVNVSLGGQATIGNSFYLRTGVGNTEVGATGTRIRVGPKGVLSIGDRVGASNVTIVANESVRIGNDVLLGGGVQIFDTNFHSLDAADRAVGDRDRAAVSTAPITIGDRVFIGTNVIVCKGVHIGAEAIVAAGSVVVSDIPAGDVWGGNPARKIR